MTRAFLTVLDMSITASIVILAVLLVRIPLKKAPMSWRRTAAFSCTLSR